MATATRPAPPITLTLTEEEAQVLQDIFQYIAGGPITSRRKLINGLSVALQAVGMRSKQDISDMEGVITFGERENQ